MEQEIRFTKEFEIESTEQTAEGIEISFSSEANVTLRSIKDNQYMEVLKHSEDAIDFSRLIDGGLPLMINHSKSLEDQIGRVENIYLDPVEKKLRGRAIFADTAKAKEVAANTKFFKGVSFGYMYSQASLNFYTKNGVKYGEPAKWVPYEVSVVAIPEDVTVGFNKSLDSEIHEEVSVTKDNDIQDTQIEQKSELKTLTDSLDSLETKTKSITNIQEVNNMENQAQETKEMAPVTMPKAVEFRNKDISTYSITNHIKGLMNGSLSGVEREVAQELGSEKTIPTQAFAKALNLSTGNTEFNIPAFGGYLDILLPQSALSKLGVQTINLTGAVNLPGAETPDYAAVSEVDGSGASVGSVTSRDVNFFPKIAVAQFDTSRVALENSTPGMDSYLASIMLKKHAADFEAKAIAQLISEITAGNTVACEDTTTHLISADDLLALMLKVTSVIDLPLGSGFLTNWTMFNKLKTIKRDATLDRAINENGMIWDLPSVPSAHVAKVSTYDPVIFGAWSNALTASFGNGVNILVDPYTKAIKDQVVITGQAHWDAHLMDTKAFAKIVDAK